MKVTISLCVFASLLVTFTDAAALTGKWPPVDQPPPPVKEWTALVDLTKVPNAPLVKVADVGVKCLDKDTFCNWSCSNCTKPDSDVILCPTKGDWGITFDDGPTENTTGLLDFLDNTGDKVTFFVVGSRVYENPEILQRAAKAGHQIGIHTWSHPYLTSQSNEQIIAEFKWTEAAIKQAVGLTPKYVRPPYGDVDDRVRGIATQLGYKVVIWDKDTNDWMSADDKSFQLTWIEGNFTEWVKEPATTGHISLEHDLYKQTAGRAPIVLPIVTKAGFSIKPISVCLGEKPYVEDVSLNTTTTTAPAPAPTAAPTADAAPAYPSAIPSASSTPATTSAANTLNSANLWSFVSFIVGSVMFI
ncbi:glycoside hydrolase/deacetylase [Rhizophagus irregularis]|uniref:Glycoside hydrolase/deacetylase n=1 Tax=Rhizophagus irregularis TaxID=588596 RepID=A0A2I1HD38_9GLOM|nr:glycoside hydrolase/deacetylase [Rhizophagus irregularis]